MNFQLNLLPIECSQSREQRRQATLWGASAIVVAVVLLILQQMINLFICQFSDRYQKSNESIAHISSMNEQMLKQQASIVLMQANLKTSADLEQSNVPLALLQVVGDCCGALEGNIRLQSLRMDETLNSNYPGQKTKTRLRKQLTLVGSGLSDDAVSTFVGLLQASKVFQQVELQSSQAQNEQQFSQRLFQIRCSQ